jgi:selenocysteine lyase/cysteine desulfurase
VLTSFDPAQGCAIGLLSLEGRDPEKVTAHLWDRHRIIVTPIKHPEFQGLRITPNLYTTLGEVDSFIAAIDEVLRGKVG